MRSSGDTALGGSQGPQRAQKRPMETEQPVSSLTLAEAARIMREAVRDKSYQLTPIGAEAAGYLRAKRKRLTDSSYTDYESGLDKLARYFPDLRIEDFEPPAGTERVEEFLDAQWGAGPPRTYNKNLSIVKDFFRFQIMRGHLHGDPTLPIERARSRQVYRTTFTTDQRRAIIAEQDSRRDRIALRLLLDYGLRKGALRAVQFKHFDHQRRRLTIFTKGQKVREMPLPIPRSGWTWSATFSTFRPTRRTTCCVRTGRSQSESPTRTAAAGSSCARSLTAP
jgi:site-specific recombinase XerC